MVPDICPTVPDKGAFLVWQVPDICPTGKEQKMDTIKLSIRLSQDVFDMLNTLEQKENDDNKRKNLPETCKTDIIKKALREYYARHIDQSTENAYMAMVTSTLDNLLSPYMKSMMEIMQKISSKTDKTNDSVQLESLMNRMCFSILFRASNMPEDETKIRKILLKHTKFDEILVEIARNSTEYNSIDEVNDKE